MNFLFLSELFYPHGGGAELATYLYAKLVSKAGYDVIVITNKFAGDPEISKIENLTIYRLPLCKTEKSVKYAILQRFDVLISRFFRKMVEWADVAYVPRFWYSAIPFVKLLGKPVVVHLHDYLPICPLSNYYDAFEDKVCKRNSGICSGRCIYAWETKCGRGFFEAISSLGLNSTLSFLWSKYISMSDAIICVSKAHKNVIAKANPSFLEKIHMIYNPLPDVHPTAIKGDDFGYFGGPNFLKGFEVLTQALELINRDSHRRITVHATKFSHFSDPFSNALREKGFKIYGKLRKTRYEKLYGQIRCVIVPSIWQETFSYVTLEALLRGRVVIASEIGAIPEVVEGCDGVLLFSPRDHKQLAEKILHIKDLSKETIVDLGIKNRERVIRKFNNEKAIGNFIQLLTMRARKSK